MSALLINTIVLYGISRCDTSRCRKAMQFAFVYILDNAGKDRVNNKTLDEGEDSKCDSKPSITKDGSGGAMGGARTTRFDVFLSYAEEDEEFVEELRTRLVQENL